ncbi:MAG TPA: hypothetical protein PK208_05730 [Fibrobacteria bacterium]|nr:hypothetical protein [Fibrobacteria bacterium]
MNDESATERNFTTNQQGMAVVKALKHTGIWSFAIFHIFTGCNVEDNPPPTLRKAEFSLSLVTAKGIVNADDRRITISRLDAEKGCSGIVNGFDTLRSVDSLLIRFDEKYYIRIVDSTGAFALDFVKNFIEGDNILVFNAYPSKRIDLTPNERRTSLFVTN